MDDLISRQAAIDEVRNYYDPEDTSVTSIEDRIKRLPSVTPGRWIPCSERLPESDCEFLCCDAYRQIIIGLPFVDEEANTGFSAEGEIGYMLDCVAWMPLPEPYGGEQE